MGGPWVRDIDAVLAASAAAASTACWAMANRPPVRMRNTNSMNAGTQITVSITADPRSSLRVRSRRMDWLFILW